MTKNEVKEPQKDSKANPNADSAGSGLSKLFAETKSELEKVVWPSRQQLISESAAVLLMVVAVATFVYLIDALYKAIALKVFQ
ncbi:MAG: preprotein translocase subunit SecE [Pseudanabaenaceae cyanobacterium]|jgi:preprotein translocase subunit SecE